MSNAFYNTECEMAFLGAVFLNNKILDNLPPAVQSEIFYDQKNRIVFQAMKKLYSEGNGVDILSVPQLLEQTGTLGKAGGYSYLSSLTDQVPSAANYSYYMNRVIDCYKNRELKNCILEMKEKVGNATPEELTKDFSEKLYRIETLDTCSKIKLMPQVMDELKTQVAYNVEHWGEEKGVYLGFPTLDRMTCGLQPTDMVVIGARPSIGKTAIATNMMDNVLSKGKAVGFISAEMSSMLIGFRLISQKTGVSSLKFRTGVMSDSQHASIDLEAEKYKANRLYIDDTPNISLNALVSSCRHFKNHYNVDIIFIDYIGLINVELQGQHWEKVAQVSQTIKKLTRELQVPIVVLSQLGREAEGNQPNLANIRGSGAIEQDADLVMFVDGKRDVSSIDNPVQILERTLLVSKNRNGPTGKIYLNFDKSITKFTEDPDQAAREKAEAEGKK